MLESNYIGADENVNDTEGKSMEQIKEEIENKEAQTRATILEIVGDLPDADVAPPENILFVCKLNPVTSSEDLEIIFSRFGKINSCEVIKDRVTNNSLQYAFIEFAERKSCEDAYFKMDNVLIDERRIHVDFSQSVSKIKWKGKGKIEYYDDDGNKIDSKSNKKFDPNKETAKKSNKNHFYQSNKYNNEKRDLNRFDRNRKYHEQDRKHHEQNRKHHEQDRKYLDRDRKHYDSRSSNNYRNSDKRNYDRHRNYSHHRDKSRSRSSDELENSFTQNTESRHKVLKQLRKELQKKDLQNSSDEEEHKKKHKKKKRKLKKAKENNSDTDSEQESKKKKHFNEDSDRELKKKKKKKKKSKKKKHKSHSTDSSNNSD